MASIYVAFEYFTLRRPLIKAEAVKEQQFHVGNFEQPAVERV